MLPPGLLDRRSDPAVPSGRVPRPPRSWPVLVALFALLAAACGNDTAPAPTTTTGTALPPRTTLPPIVTTAPAASTTTTIPAEVATEVDACGLLQPQEVRDCYRDKTAVAGAGAAVRDLGLIVQTQSTGDHGLHTGPAVRGGGRLDERILDVDNGSRHRQIAGVPAPLGCRVEPALKTCGAATRKGQTRRGRDFEIARAPRASGPRSAGNLATSGKQDSVRVDDNV